MANFPKSKGGLWLNANKVGEKHPDLRGHLMVTSEQIQILIRLGQSGQDVKLQVAGWQRVSQEGVAYMYLEGEAYIREEQPAQNWGGQQQQAPAQPQYQQPAQGAQPASQYRVPQQQQAPAQPPAQGAGWGNLHPQALGQSQNTGYTQTSVPPDFSDDDIPF